MGRRSNYDNRGFQDGANQQGGGVFGRLSQQQAPRQEDTRQGGLGRGYRGGQGQQNSNRNRFGAFNEEQDDRWAPNAPQGRGGQRRDPRQQPADWRAVVRDDMKNEQAMPPWPFTCYAHQRGEANDIIGDFSYEEVRWYQMEAAKSGKSLASLMADFNASRKAQEQRFQTLLRMGRPPSLSHVPPEEPPNPFTAQQNPFQPATPFVQIVGAFGAGPAAVPPGPSFGGAFTPSPAQSMPNAGPFSSSRSSTGFGGSQQATPTPFGGQKLTVFGQPSAARQPAFGGAQTATPFFGGQPSRQGAFSRPPDASAGASPPPSGVFGAQHQQQTSGPFGGAGFGSGTGFQADSSPGAAFGMAQQQDQAQGMANGAEDENPWLAQSFKQRQIPEMPPPPEVC